jgi:hypothetical protein
LKADPSLALGALQLSYARGNVKVEPRPTWLTTVTSPPMARVGRRYLGVGQINPSFLPHGLCQLYQGTTGILPIWYSFGGSAPIKYFTK